MNIREFREDDRQDFLIMSKRFYCGGSVIRDIPEKYRTDTFDEIMKGNPLIKGYIFENSAEIVGYGLLTFFYSCEAGGTVCLIDELYVKPDYRGMGFGTQYLYYVFRTHPECKFRLEVRPNKIGAVKLYEKLGFKKINYNQYIKV